MAVVVQLCPSVCASSHFAVLLGAYGASLSILGECGNWGVGPGGVGQGAVTQESVGIERWDLGVWGPNAMTWDRRDQGVWLRGMGTGRCCQKYMGGLEGSHQEAF